MKIYPLESCEKLFANVNYMRKELLFTQLLLQVHSIVNNLLKLLPT